MIGGPSSAFATALEQFAATMDATKELFEHVAPQIEDESDVLRRFAEDAATRDARLLPPEKIPEVTRIARELSAALAEIYAQLDEDSVDDPWISREARQPVLTLRAGNEIEIVAFEADDPRHKRILIPVDDPDLVATLRSLVREVTLRVKAVPKTQILRRSLLIMTVAAAEVLIVQLLTAYYKQHSGALESQRAEFSLDDLRSFESLADADDAAVARRVDSLISKSLEDWAQWFKANVNIDLKRLAISWVDLSEVFQRRHVIVHNGGQVSRRYLAATKASPDPRPPLGAEILIDDDYLVDAMEAVLVFGFSLAVAMWFDIGKDNLDAATVRLLDRAESLATDNRYRGVSALCSISDKLQMNAATRLEFNVLKWLATKHLDGLTQVASEIDQWDVSALAPLFTLEKACLLDDVDAAIELLPELLRSKQVTRRDLERAVFEPLRTAATFDDVAGIARRDSTGEDA
jgi:hypothetical protein